MHTTDLGTANVPAFLTKLWKLVEDPLYNDLICWNAVSLMRSCATLLIQFVCTEWP